MGVKKSEEEYFFLFLIEFIGVTLVHETIQVSSVYNSMKYHLYTASCSKTSWGEKEEYFVICENYMKLKF